MNVRRTVHRGRALYPLPALPTDIVNHDCHSNRDSAVTVGHVRAEPSAVDAPSINSGFIFGQPAFQTPYHVGSG